MDQCVSQYFYNNFCAFKPNPPTKSFNLCPLKINSVKSIEGDLTDEGYPYINSDRPTPKDNSKVTDDSLNTIYANKWSNGSALEITPAEVAPIKSFRVCSVDDCPECDPKCYKIEGKFAETGVYKVVEEMAWIWVSKETLV